MNLSAQKTVVISIIAVMILYAIIVVMTDYNKLAYTISSMRFEFIPLVFGLQFIAFFLRSIRQKEFFKKIDINISIKKNFYIFLSGLSMLMTPGGTGSAIKMQFLKNEFGHQRRRTVPIVFYERYQDYLAIITIMIAISSVYSFFTSQILIGISSVILLVTFLVIKNERAAKIVFSRLGGLNLVKRFLTSTEETITSLRTLLATKTFVLGWILSITAVFFDLFATYLIFISLGTKIDFITSSQLFLTSIIAGVMSFLPAGFGITEASFLGLLVSNGFELAVSSAAVLTIRFLTLWFSTVVGFITLRFVKV